MLKPIVAALVFIAAYAVSPASAAPSAHQEIAPAATVEMVQYRREYRHSYRHYRRHRHSYHRRYRR